MPSHKTPDPHSSSEDRAKRQDALRELLRTPSESSAQTPQPSAEVTERTRATVAVHRSPLFSRGWGVALLSSVLVIAIGVGVAAKLTLFAPKVAQPRAVIAIQIGQDGIQCPVGVAWSQNNGSLAVLGYAPNQDGCPSDFLASYSYAAGTLELYDTATGRLRQQFHPDDLIRDALKLLPPPQGAIQPSERGSDTTQQVIAYQGISWSATGAALALPFEIRNIATSNNSAGFSIQRVCSLLLIHPDGASPTVLSTSLPVTTQCSGEWDIRDGKYVRQVITAQPTLQSWGISGSLGTASSAYHWQGGALTAENTLPLEGAIAPTAPSQVTPVGNPDGQPSFSVWQPGTLGEAASYQPNGSNINVPVLPGAQTYSSSFIAWSPDGAYLTTASLYGWLVRSASVPGPTASSLAKLQLSRAPTLSVRDLALDSILKENAPVSASVGQDLLLAWRSDGRYIASALPQGNSLSGELNPRQYAVALYDAANGSRALTLNAPPTLATVAIPGGSPALTWSPDGSHLAYLASDLSTLIIWEPAALKPLAAPA